MGAETADGPATESRRSGPLVAVARWMENLSETAYAYFLLIPVFVLLGVIALYPLLKTFELSLLEETITGVTSNYVGFENYVELFTGVKDRWLPGSTTFLPDVSFTGSFPFVSVENGLRSALVVTLLFTFIGVFFETIIGLGQALVLDKDFYGRRWLRVAVIIPWAVPIVVQGIIFFLMFNQSLQFVHPVMADLGLMAQNNPLNDPFSSLLVIIVADVWKTSAFMALLILAGLQSIDRGLYDVARVAGATPWQQFKMITFPLILPTIGVAMLFRTVQAMRVYGIIDAVSACEVVPSLSCMVVSTFLSNQATSAAIAFVTAGIIGLFVSVIIYQQYQEGM